MNFSDMIQPLLDGKRIARKEWDDIRIYYLLADGILLSVHKAGEAEDVTHPFALNDGDLRGEDWFVL